jgi:hypothetical protein
LFIVLLNSSSTCIFISFPPNFHISIGRLSGVQLFLFSACLSNLFNSSFYYPVFVVICHFVFLSSTVPSSPLLPCSFHSFPLYSFHSYFFGSNLNVFLSWRCSCLIILNPRLCFPVMSLSTWLFHISKSKSIKVNHVVILSVGPLFGFEDFTSALLCPG